MTFRITAALIALVIAAPIAPAFAGDPAESMGCCSSGDDESPERPEITRRCCCDIDREPPVEPSVSPIPAVAGSDEAPVAGAGVALPRGDLIAGRTRVTTLPRPRGPPPRTPLLAQKTSLLL